MAVAAAAAAAHGDVGWDAEVWAKNCSAGLGADGWMAGHGLHSCCKGPIHVKGHLGGS